MLDEPFDMYEPEDEGPSDEEQTLMDEFLIDKYEAQCDEIY